MKIFGFEITISRGSKDVPSAGVETKGTLTWEKLWGSAREFFAFDVKVTKPYKQVSSVYKAVKAICDNVPQAEMAIYRWEDDEEIQNPDDELYRLFRKPNSKQSFNDFIQELVGFYALNNEAFILKVKGIGNATGSRKLPAELKVLSPQEVKPVISRDTDEITSWTYRNNRYELDEIIHIKDFNPYDKNRGMNPQGPLGAEMELDYLASIYNKAFFNNDATPNAILTTEGSLSEMQRKRLKADLESRHAGAGNKHKMDIFEGGIKLQTISPSHKDMEFTEQRKFSREELLGAWRAPKALFNITEDLNYATFQGQMKIFWLYAIMPILRKIEDSFNMHIVEPYNPRVYFGFNLKNVPAFQEDFAGKVTTAKTLFEMGFTANEINQKLQLGFDEKDWRNFWWIGFGIMPADAETAKDNYYNPDSTPADDNNADDPKKAGSADTSIDVKKFKIWKSFIAKQAPIEKLMQKKLSRYFYEQRKRILDSINEQNYKQGPDVVNWGAEDDTLKKYMRPYVKQAVNDGADHGADMVGKKKSIENIDTHLNAYIEARLSQIVGINNTTRKLLRKKIDEGIKAGETVQQITERIKDQYNLNSMRSLRIARTETAGGVNGGSQIYYEEVGVSKKRWITAHDEGVRESHRECERQGAINMTGAFTNGCRYPGDQEADDPGEVVNCRCTLAPVVE